MGKISLEYQTSSREVSALFPSYHPLCYHNAIVLSATFALVRLVVGYYKVCIYMVFMLCISCYVECMHRLLVLPVFDSGQLQGSIDEVDAAPVVLSLSILINCR
jgi:hypothetical protein